MKRIGEIAGRLVANPIELVAAANQKRSTQIEGGSEPSTRGRERPDSLPMLKAGESPTEQTGMEKAGVGGDRTQPVVGGGQQSGETAHALDNLTNERHMPHALPMSRNMRVTSPNGLPRPVARIFLVTIDGVRVHHPAPKSIPARKTMVMTATSTSMF